VPVCILTAQVFRTVTRRQAPKHKIRSSKILLNIIETFVPNILRHNFESSIIKNVYFFHETVTFHFSRRCGEEHCRSLKYMRRIYFLNNTSLLKMCKIISHHLQRLPIRRSFFQLPKTWHRNIKIFYIDVYKQVLSRKLDVVFLNQNIFSSIMINRDNYPYVFAIFRGHSCNIVTKA